MKVKETQLHVASHYPGYQDMRELYDLETDDGLLDLYWAVLSRRKEKEEDD